MKLWAVVPSFGRLEMLTDLVTHLKREHVNIVIVDNGYQIPPKFDDVHVIIHHEKPPNISRLWNLGLRYVAEIEEDSEYVVAVLNDDLRLTGPVIHRLASAIMKHDVAASFPAHQSFAHDYIMRDPNPTSVFRRMTGFIFALRGSKKIFADEELAWWFGDDDLDWRARQAGGVVGVAGLNVEHLAPNSTTKGDLVIQAQKDRKTFEKKWGCAPW